MENKVPARTGECRQCGQCCRHFGWLVVYATDDTLEWIRARDPEIKIESYNDIEDFYYVSVPYECKQLVDLGDGRFHCRLHDEKPHLCKQYPEHTDILKPGCGFSFSPSIEVLDSPDD